MFSNAPLGQNLESACKAWKHRKDREEAERKRKEQEERDREAWEAHLRHFEETGSWY